jgi:molybdate transport system ATP-binding protein
MVNAFLRLVGVRELSLLCLCGEFLVLRMIEIRNVEIIKSGRRLYSNFTWKIEDGEHWIIAGPNGGGKTLLIEILAGIAHVAKGEVVYDFINAKTWDEAYAEKRRHITCVPTHALNEFVRRDELYYQQRYYRISEDDTPLVKDFLEAHTGAIEAIGLPANFRITHLLNVAVSRLSNGQLKKLLILKNFLKGVPKLLLLDYPFEGLDAASRKDFIDFIDFLPQRYGVQVIIIDHGEQLPSSINRRLTIKNFKIDKIERVENSVKVNDHSSSYLPHSHSPSNGREIIRIENLNLRYGTHSLFNNFNWVVNKGERWALTGRNGTGKTTLFSLIFADHPQAYAQKVYLFGKRRGSGESIWDIKKRINYLGPEQINFLDGRSLLRTGFEYVEGSSPGFAQSAYNELLGRFDASRLMQKKVNTLSSGEKQLLMIITCFLSDRELWLLDEPFQFLDPLQRRRVATFLSSHLSPDITLILITHNDDDLTEWTDRRMEL